MKSPQLVIPASFLAAAYALIIGFGLVATLVLGMRLHYTDLVHTHCETAEYWPSISATTGDFMPERAVWRIAVALAMGLRVVASFSMFRLYRGFTSAGSSAKGGPQRGGSSLLQRVVGMDAVDMMWYCDMVRIGSAMGWTYVTSAEMLMFHEISFAVYIVSGFVLQVTQVVIVARSKHLLHRGTTAFKLKLTCLVGQSVCAILVGVFFVHHNKTCAPGAYSRSTICEWGFAFFNVLFDATQYLDLHHDTITIGGGESAEDQQPVRLLSPPSQGELWAADVFFGYLWWSSMLHLLQSVYFIPMVAMQFTAEVLMIMAPLSALLLYNGRFLAFVRSKKLFGAIPVGAAFYGLSLLSLFGMDVTRDAGRKLIVQGLGPFFLSLGMMYRWFHDDSAPGDFTDGDASRILYSLPLGLVVSMTLRIMHVSLDPLFTNAVYNIVLGAAFGTWAFSVLLRKAICGSKDEPAQAAEEGNSPTATNPPAILAKGAAAVPPAACGIAFGALSMLSMMLVSSYNVVGRLVGVTPFPSGIAVILSFLGGLWLASSSAAARGDRTMTPISLAKFILGGLAVMTFATKQSNRMFQKAGTKTVDWSTPISAVTIDDWYVEEMSGSPSFAFLGGLVLVFGLGLAWPVVMEHCVLDLRLRLRGNPAGGPPPSVLGSFEAMSFFSFAVFLVGSVYVVCFPFIPGGFLLRDRLDWVLLLNALVVLGALEVIRRRTLKDIPHTSDAVSTNYRSFPAHIVRSLLVLLIVALSARAISSHSVSLQPGANDFVHDAYVEKASNKIISERARIIKSWKRSNLTEKEEGEVRKMALNKARTKYGPVANVAQAVAPVSAMIWTIHFGLDNYGVDSFQRLTDKIRATGAGIVGLLESDTARVVNGNRDIVEYVGYHLGFDYEDYGPTTFDGTFGCALITKYPILSSKRYVMPSPLGELACLIHAEVDILGVRTHVYVGHWGNTDHVADRKLQSQFLGQLAVNNPGPSIFLGYLTTKPGHENYMYFANSEAAGQLRDPAASLYRGPWYRKDPLEADPPGVDPNAGGEGHENPDLTVASDEVEKVNNPAVQQEKGYEFVYPGTHRRSTAHPRWEYVDRYCQYILFKSGAPTEEASKAIAKSSGYFGLYDWFRVLEIDELSDTEIQVIQLRLSREPQKEGEEERREEQHA